MKNRAIRELYGRWKFNADLMTCQECGYSVIATRMHETAHHAAGCKNAGDSNPWLQLADMLNELKVGTDHDWECVSPGEYDSLYECRKCGAQHMEQTDRLGSCCPRFGCQPNAELCGGQSGPSERAPG